jgi:outer membrane lipoprotein-sorting protein
MKKTLLWALVGAFVISSLPVPGHGQTAGEVLEKMIQAQAGRTVLEGIKDTTIAGTMELVQQGMNATMTMYQKEPNLLRMDMEVMGMVITQAYDGKKGWSLNPQTGAAQDMDENMNKEFKRQALGNDSLLNPAKYGITYVAKPREKVGDKEYLVLEQTMEDGHKSTLYIDPETYLPARTKTTALSPMGGGEIQSETVFNDYKKAGDVMVAHSMTIFQDGTEFARMTLTKITYNSGLEDSLFQMSQ